MSRQSDVERDPLGDRMKEYEYRCRLTLPRRTYAVVRVDGRAFHSWTRGLDRPYDLSLVESLGRTMQALCGELSGSVLGYAQSDEISIVLQDFARESTQAWFGGQTQKMASIAASATTAFFAQEWPLHRVPMFDARVFALPSVGEVANYLLWRQRDARRNAISMIAEAHFSHRELHGKPTDERRAMLTERGIPWADADPRFLHGQVCERYETRERVSYVDKRSGEERTTPEPVSRRKWRVLPAPDLHARDGWLLDRLPHPPTSDPITNSTRCVVTENAR